MQFRCQNSNILQVGHSVIRSPKLVNMAHRKTARFDDETLFSTLFFSPRRVAIVTVFDLILLQRESSCCFTSEAALFSHTKKPKKGLRFRWFSHLIHHFVKSRILYSQHCERSELCLIFCALLDLFCPSKSFSDR